MIRRVALVTGASRRIGAAIIQSLHQAGFAVIIHFHRSHTEAEALCDTLNHQRTSSALTLQADLRKKEAVHKLMEDAIAWQGQLDLLVNNASIFVRDEHADWREIFTTNVEAPFWLSHIAYPHLVKTQGAIVNITDIHADTPLKHYSIYCQSKAALKMQTLSLAVEFAPYIRVNAIAPGAILWPEGENTLQSTQQEKIIMKTLLQKHGNPQYLAQAILALAENKFITGQSLRVDGGRNY